MVTSAPSESSSRAVARPMPREPPVTRARAPSKDSRPEPNSPLIKEYTLNYVYALIL